MSKGGREDCAQNFAQEIGEPADQSCEVVAGGGHLDVEAVARLVAQEVSAEPVLGFHMTDDGLDRRPAARFLFEMRVEGLAPGHRDAPWRARRRT